MIIGWGQHARPIAICGCFMARTNHWHVICMHRGILCGETNHDICNGSPVDWSIMSKWLQLDDVIGYHAICGKWWVDQTNIPEYHQLGKRWTRGRYQHDMLFSFSYLLYQIRRITWSWGHVGVCSSDGPYLSLSGILLVFPPDGTIKRFSYDSVAPRD